ncbi:MAG: DUF2500 domain-containing protein, partial [Methanimicrococcus sp.]|nr:DUF2500 domain-containing protein [Methanimicrococcus sp.]
MRAVAKWKIRKGGKIIDPMLEIIAAFFTICLFGLVTVGSIALVLIILMRKGIKQNRLNDSLPVETIRATVKSNAPIRLIRPKSDRRVFVTFETEKGDMKFSFSPRKYSALELKVLKNGDVGTLHYQGTRFIDFVKEQLETGHDENRDTYQ